MELSNNEKVDNPLELNKDFLQVSCNWQISNNRQFHDIFTTAPSSQEQEIDNFDTMVKLSTCVSLQPTQSSNEPCMLEIKLTNHQKISSIVVVSEAYVLEFFKQFGEYETTVFAELVDEFEDNSVYLAEKKFIPPTSEASIKFTKTKSKNSVMWIYGIMLYLTEPINDSKNADVFNFGIIKHFLTKLSFNDEENNASIGVQSCYKNISNSSKNLSTEESHENKVEQSDNEHIESNMDIKAYIDNKLHNMETRMIKRINEMEQKTNEKLDNILKLLETQFSTK
ncbi:uncharacterized protein LOC116431640 isoform X1 [Nomia melanderi]|uniref:uncharacterized protein LOC116431640 isoform X1 n=2 Tax=Nomia melanderi TaxID=2448451 RepID=UPI003FCCAA48